MNQQTPSPENTGSGNAKPDVLVAPAKTTGKTSVTEVFSRVSITQMTLAVLVAIFLWQWLAGHLAINEMQQHLAKKIAEMDGNSKANQMLMSQNQDQVRELSAKMAMLETRYSESLNQRAALETLYNDLSASRDETALAEVEQMLLIADQQLQLSANVKAALIAMQSADARLQRMNRPSFSGLRKAINHDMEKLRALPSVDITGINLQLNNLIVAVDDLPLGYQQRTVSEQRPKKVPSKEENNWQKLAREVWEDAKHLVRIENTGQNELPLLTPNQEFFLRENLRMRLMSARLALLSRDEESFRQELRTTQLWMARYLDAKSAENARMQAGLKTLAASSINMELPDISPSLQAVRNYRLKLEKTVR